MDKYYTFNFDSRENNGKSETVGMYAEVLLLTQSLAKS